MTRIISSQPLNQLPQDELSILASFWMNFILIIIGSNSYQRPDVEPDMGDTRDLAAHKLNQSLTRV